MKLSCLLFSLSLTLPASGQIVVSGKIKHYDGKTKVYYRQTLDGVAPAYSSSQHLVPNADGTFQIKCENHGLGETAISFNNISFLFIHGEKAAVTFTIDQSKIKFPKGYKRHGPRADHVIDSVKQAALESIDGDFAEVNRFNNRSVRTSVRTFSVEGCDFSLLIQKANSPKRAAAILDSLIQIELRDIDHLGALLQSEPPKTPVVNDEVKKFLVNDIYAFYGSVFLNSMMLKRFEQAKALLKDSNAELRFYNRQWEKLIEDFINSTSIKLFPAANSYTYNEFILNATYTASDYKKYDFDPPTKSNDELIISRLINPKFNKLDSLFMFNTQVLLAYKIHNLSRFLTDQTFYSPTLMNAVAQVEHDYPSSSQIALLQPQIDKLRAFLKTSGGKFAQAEIIETNYVRFTDLLEKFKGNDVLIDVWATWCGSCHEDFAYKTMFKPFIDEGKIKVLYVSIDKERWIARWKESIKYNQLEGIHVLANDVLIGDMWEFLKGKQGLIPRFVLIDKAGNVFTREAARMSAGGGQILLDQINQLLNSTGK